MPAFRKSQLSTALGVALGTLALVPSLGFSFTADMDDRTLRTDDGADTLLQTVYTTVYEPGGGGPTFNPDGTISGFADLKATTNIHITNTSDSDTVVAKVRFREQKRSMEVMDFMVVLTPNDQFSGWVGQDGARGTGPYPWYRPTAQGGPGELPFLQWKDNTCVIASGKVQTEAADPNTNTPATQRVSFPVPSQFVDSVEDLSLGHVEIIGMAAYDENDTIAELAAAHTTNSCNQLNNIFSSRAGLDNGDAYDDAADVEDVLTGRWYITANGQGVEYGANMIGLKDTFDVPYVAAQNNQACVADPLVGATSGVNPTNALDDACHSLYAWDNAESAHPHLGDMNISTWSANPPQIPNLDSELGANILSGDWSNNGPNNVSTDWVVSFADKYVYSDYVNCVQEISTNANTDSRGPAATQAREWCLVNYEAESALANGPVNSAGTPNNRRDLWARTVTNEGTPWGPETTYLATSCTALNACTNRTFGPTNAGFNPATSLCLFDNDMAMWNIDEMTTSVTSPNGDPSFELCNETFVMTMLESDVFSGVEAFPSLIQYQDRREMLVYTEFSPNYETNRGVAKLYLNWQPVVGRSDYAQRGATLGEMAVQRRTDGPSVNNGVMSELNRIIDVWNPATQP